MTQLVWSPWFNNFWMIFRMFLMNFFNAEKLGGVFEKIGKYWIWGLLKLK